MGARLCAQYFCFLFIPPTSESVEMFVSSGGNPGARCEEPRGGQARLGSGSLALELSLEPGSLMPRYLHFPWYHFSASWEVAGG